MKASVVALALAALFAVVVGVLPHTSSGPAPPAIVLHGVGFQERAPLRAQARSSVRHRVERGTLTDFAAP
jgi:hypothetical protein